MVQAARASARRSLASRDEVPPYSAPRGASEPATGMTRSAPIPEPAGGTTTPFVRWTSGASCLGSADAAMASELPQGLPTGGRRGPTTTSAGWLPTSSRPMARARRPTHRCLRSSSSSRPRTSPARSTSAMCSDRRSRTSSFATPGCSEQYAEAEAGGGIVVDGKGAHFHHRPSLVPDASGRPLRGGHRDDLKTGIGPPGGYSDDLGDAAGAHGAATLTDREPSPLPSRSAGSTPPSSACCHPACTSPSPPATRSTPSHPSSGNRTAADNS